MTQKIFHYCPFILVVSLLAFFSAVLLDHSRADQPKEGDRFAIRDIEGWKVHVENVLLEGKEKALGDRALRMLANKLFDIKLLMAEDRIKKLQKVPIFLELENPKLKSMQYHPSRGWLKANGHDTRLTKAVHIPRARQFASPQMMHHQPWAVLHELAHAYHDREFGFGDEKIRQAYARYMDLSDKKKDVLYITGRTRPHYARTNPMEFFAEFTEAYFGTNDFYPFVTGELKQEYPHVFDLMREIWGKLP